MFPFKKKVKRPKLGKWVPKSAFAILLDDETKTYSVIRWNQKKEDPPVSEQFKIVQSSMIRMRKWYPEGKYDPIRKKLARMFAPSVYALYLFQREFDAHGDPTTSLPLTRDRILNEGTEWNALSPFELRDNVRTSVGEDFFKSLKVKMGGMGGTWFYIIIAGLLIFGVGIAAKFMGLF
jgi:hypothetical protein